MNYVESCWTDYEEIEKQSKYIPDIHLTGTFNRDWGILSFLCGTGPDNELIFPGTYFSRICYDDYYYLLHNSDIERPINMIIEKNRFILFNENAVRIYKKKDLVPVSKIDYSEILNKIFIEDISNIITLYLLPSLNYTMKQKNKEELADEVIDKNMSAVLRLITPWNRSFE